MTPSARQRVSIATVFAATAIAAWLVGGWLLTGAASAPALETAWLAKYLVLIAGLLQLVAGGGRAWLGPTVPGMDRVALEWGLLNLGNLGVVVGSLLANLPVVAAGIVAFDVALGLFFWATRGGARRAWLWGYRVVLVVGLLASWVGLVFAAAAYR